jgi:hypothetical protein
VRRSCERVVVEKVQLVAGWLFGNRAVGPSTQVTGKATYQELGGLNG